jgi:hypothetical protein
METTSTAGPAARPLSGWAESGREYNSTEQQRARILGAVAALAWVDLRPGVQLTLTAASILEACEQDMGLPATRRYAESGALAPFALVGVEYKPVPIVGMDGLHRVRVMYLDTGLRAVPVLIEYHPE